MSSRLRDIARMDAMQVRKHRLFWAAFGLVAFLMLPGVLNGRPLPEVAYNYRIYGVLLVAVLSVNAVGGERSSGRIRLLLGLPGSRSDVFLGKLAVRLLLSLVGVVGLLALLTLGVFFRGDVPGLSLLTAFLWMSLYGTAWTGFVVGASGAFDSWFRSAAAVLVAYVALDPSLGIWETLLLPVLSFPFTGQFGTGAVSSIGTSRTELWYQYVGRLNPVNAFMYGSTVDVFRPLPNLFGVLVLLAFGAIPAYLGYRRFEKADLG